MGKKSLMQNVYPYQDILDANKGKNFIKRILDPESAPSPLLDEAGHKQTHRMSAEYLGEGGTLPAAFPLVIERDGKLVLLSKQEAAEHARKTGEYVAFKDIKSADEFSRSYKTREFKAFYNGGK